MLRDILIVVKRLLACLIVVGGALGAVWFWESHKQARMIEELRGRLDRLRADQLVADLAVVSQNKAVDGTIATKLSFVLYKPDGGETLLTKTFEVAGDEVYVDALVVRFEDKFIELGDGLRGKSLLLFRRAFGNQQKPDQGVPLYTTGDGHDPVPDPLRIAGETEFQRNLWARFWSLASDPDLARKEGVRVAQGEAPHIKVKPQQVYQLTLRAAGGLEMRPRLPGGVQRALEQASK
jgi:hypothetical protein